MRASIIIAVYQERETVARAVTSALAQTMSEIEVLLVDDCSGDDTVMVAERAAAGDPRFRVIRLDHNRGASSARNAGIDAACGDWIALLDGDDRFAPDRLATLVQKAVAWNCDMLADNLHVTWVNGRYADHLAFPAARMSTQRAIRASAFVASDRPRWGLRAAGYMKPIVRRSFLIDRSIRYLETARLGEDFYFYVRCLIGGAVLRYTTDALYTYYVREGSLSSRTPGETATAQMDVNALLVRYASEAGDRQTVRELQRRARDIALWTECLELRDVLRSRRLLAAATRFWSLRSKTYALARMSEKAGKAVSARLGRMRY